MTERGEREPLLAIDNQAIENADYSYDTARHEHHDNVIDNDESNDGNIPRTFNRFSRLERVLFSLTAVLLILLCAFAGLYTSTAYDDEISHGPPAKPTPSHSPGHSPKNDTETSLCVTPDCVLAAADILKDIDENVNPCDDFYAYTCNNWIRSHSIPEGQSLVDTYLVLAMKNKEVLHNIMKGGYETFAKNQTGLPDPANLLDEQNFNKVKSLFDTCMNESAIDARGAKPIYPLLRELQAMYVSASLEATETSEFVIDASTEGVSQQQRLARVLAQLAKHGINGLFEMSVKPDLKDPSKISLYMRQSGLSLPTGWYYDQPDVVQSLFETIAQTMDAVFRGSGSEFGWNRWSANATARMVVEFEKRLANISDLPEDLQDPKKIYNPKTLTEMTAVSPAVDWDLYLTHLLPSNSPHQDTIIVMSPTYLEKLSTQLLSMSSPRSVQLYLMWQLVQFYSEALSIEVQMPIKKLNAKLRGTDIKYSKPRWETCVDEINGAIGFLSGRYFVLEKFSADIWQQADLFIDSIKSAFVQRLSNLTWIDETTRQRAEQKGNKIVRKVGFPSGSPDVMSPVSLSEYYAALQLCKTDYFTNRLNIHQWQVKKNWEQVGQPTDRQKWFVNPQQTNAYYNPSFNEIVFPAGILQNPFFTSGYPDYLNYGSIGTMVGHKLTHGFDRSGRQFDDQGHMVDWWTNATAAAFEQHVQCFDKQYSNVVVDDGEDGTVHDDGTRTLDESIADNGGLNQAFDAWQRRYANDVAFKNRNRLLPGLAHLSQEQLFFISFGRVWCGKTTGQQLKRNILTGPHVPARWRVNGVVQNSKHFAKAFKCPTGSPMNPTKKCQLW